MGLKRSGIAVSLGGVALAIVLAAQLVPTGALADDGSRGSVDSVGTVRPLSEELAVVDFDKLLHDRPGYERITQLDEQLALLQRELEILPLADRKRKVDSGRKRMEKEIEKAKKELQTEYARVTGELDHFQENMRTQLESEGRALTEHYQGVLREKIAALQPKAPKIPQDVHQKMEQYLSDLAVVREQRVAAKRLELERNMQSTLEAEKARIDDELAKFDSALMVENQDRRVNLQLELQTAGSPEEESAIQDKLSAINDEETEKKSAKRQEFSAAYDSLVASEKAKVDSEVKSFENALNAETRQKAEAERQRLLSKIDIPSPETNKAEVEAQIAKVRATVEAEMEAKKAEMTRTMQAKADEAHKHMMAKQADIEKRLKAVQKQLEDMVNKSNEDVSEGTRQKMDEVKKKIEDLSKQRQELYDTMVADLKRVVEQVTSKMEDPPSVIGAYVVNLDCPDLTDKVMIALESEQH